MKIAQLGPHTANTTAFVSTHPPPLTDEEGLELKRKSGAEQGIGDDSQLLRWHPLVRQSLIFILFSGLQRWIPEL